MLNTGMSMLAAATVMIDSVLEEGGMMTTRTGLGKVVQGIESYPCRMSI